MAAYKNLRWKLLLIAALTGLAVWSFTPPRQKIALGLDLQGGMQLVLQVQTDAALRIETETASEQIPAVLKDQSITVTSKVDSLTQFTVEGVPPASDQQFRTVADQQVGLTFDRDTGPNGS